MGRLAVAELRKWNLRVTNLYMLLSRVRCSSRRPSFCVRSLASATTSPIVLRPYQEHCLKSCLEALQNGVSRIGVSLPTGSGKTTVFIELLSRLRATSDLGTRALVIVNSIELARQSAATAQQLYPKWSVEIEQGAKHNASGLADLYALSLSASLKLT